MRQDVKKLLKNILLPSSILILGGMYYLNVFSHRLLDPYYWKTTTHKSHSLILGSSRAAQGIKPEVFNQSDEILFDKPIINFSFTTNLSPYGPAYFHAIECKLEKGKRNGLFIIEVNPTTLMKDKKNTKDDPSQFAEGHLFVGKLKSFSSQPNFEYLLNHFDTPFYLMPVRKYSKNEEIIVHNDGWAEVFPHPMSPSAREEHEKRTLKYNQQVFETSDFSNTRYQYLKKIVEFLMPYGDIYLVRVPVPLEMYKMEQQNMPEFDSIIEGISQEYRIPYLNLTDRRNEYGYVDINHLERGSSQKFSVDLLNIISKIKAK